MKSSIICRDHRGWLRLARRFMNVPFICTILYASQAVATPLTLEQAWEQAEQTNPALRSIQATIAAAQGELSDSRALLWNNPQLATEWRTRTIPQTASPALFNRDWTVGLT